MPLYNYVCPRCGQKSRRITKEFVKQTCGNCGAWMERDAQPPTSHNKEVIAAPHQPKDVERFSDVEKLMKERSEKDHRKAD